MIKSIGNLNTNSISNLKRKDFANVAVVRQVILDVDSNLVPDIDAADNSITDRDTTYIGAVQVTPFADGVLTPDNNEIAFPYDRTNIILPVKNEVVELIRVRGVLYYKVISNFPSPSITANASLINELDKGAGFSQPRQSVLNDYNRNSNTGIARNNNVNDNTSQDNLGEYYRGEPTIHKLRLYEGDIVLQSRFGQSIRFNGYDGENPDQNPTIFIRNRESDVTQSNIPIGGLVEEDFNRDGSSIIMSSGTRIIDFLPGTVPESSNNDFQAAPDSVTNFPSTLDGDQILISSDRLILSSRTSETLLFSKGNVGIITDQNVSIDSEGGLIGDFQEDITLTTNDSNILLDPGNGNVNLGSEELEPIVKGDALVSVLSDLIDAIIQQTYTTPAGPTGPGPVNQAQFRRLKTQLNQILSRQVFST